MPYGGGVKSGSICSPPMMIAAIRAAILKPQDHSSHLKTVFFHSTPILQRKHQSNSKARNKRVERKRAKQDLRRNVNAFADHLFGVWSDGFDFSGKHTSWFEKQYSRVSKRNRNGRHITQTLDKRCFDFCGVDDGSEPEYFIRTALGGSRGFSFSFTHEERKKTRGQRARDFSGSKTHEEGEARSWRHSNNFRRSWASRHRLDEEEEEEDTYSSAELNDKESDHKSQRQALGLSSSGPLNIEDVKNAYRTCALKWHPDRHHVSTKNAAEEKFKLCTVAYQSLCEKLAMN